MTSLSTHVLDTGAGTPAEDVRVELHLGAELLAEAQTDANSRARLTADEMDDLPNHLVHVESRPLQVGFLGEGPQVPEQFGRSSRPGSSARSATRATPQPSKP